MGIYNDEASYIGNDELGINHFLATNRRPFIRTLNNTVNRPDLKYSQNGRDYIAKKYKNSDTGKDFFDLTILENGNLFNKMQTNDAYMANQFKKTAQDLSLSGRVSNTLEGNNPVLDITNITPKQGYVNSGIFEKGMRNAVANPDLPNVSTLYDGLNEFQRLQLNEVLKRGLNKTNLKAGSLESMNEVKKELNDIINSSMQTDRKSVV